jgi:hypothetical protein
MGEFDNAGFPITYCLLSTANSIHIAKRASALSIWLREVRSRYQLENIKFVHCDKDMTEIKAVKEVFKGVKIQLCRWHMDRALRQRLGQSKLETTPYRPLRAHQQFNFIDPKFAPPGAPDPEEYEGGMPDEPDNIDSATGESFSAGTIVIPPSQAPPPPPRLTIRLPARDPGVSEPEKRIFCPSEHRQHILALTDHHLCAHPLIPGYCAPHAPAIH